MKRFFDLIIAIILLVLLAFPMLIVALIVRLTANGPALFWSERVGQFNVNFKMPKFRSMRIDAPNIPTHLMKDPEAFFTPIGSFLRLSSIDEMPQLFSIIKGDMSFVGPRPALFNQDDLIAYRNAKGVEILKPGITGWAQVNGRDDLSIPDKADFDAEYIELQSFWFDLKIIWITFLSVIKRNNISH